MNEETKDPARNASGPRIGSESAKNTFAEMSSFASP